MAGTFKLRNKTALPIELDDLGITIQALDDYDTFLVADHVLARSYNEGDLLTFVTTGDIVIVDSDGELSQADTTTVLDRLTDGVLANRVVTITGDTGSLDADDVVDKTLTFAGASGATVDISGSTITVDAAGSPGSTTPLAQMFELTFAHTSSVSDDWLQTSSIPSNETPLVVPWDAKLVGLTYSNKEQGSDVDFEIYTVAEGAGASPKTLEFTWELSNARTARKTNFSPDVTFEKGDKIAIFAADPGGGSTAPSNIRLVLHFIVTSFDETENTEDFSGNITI